MTQLDLCLCSYCLSAVLVQYKYFLHGQSQWVTLQAPAGIKGTEFIWEWTSHDGRYRNAEIVTMKSDGSHLWNLNVTQISKERKHGLSLKPELEIAGVFTFIQTKPEKVNLAQFEVFAVKGKFTLFYILQNDYI